MQTTNKTRNILWENNMRISLGWFDLTDSEYESHVW